MNKITGFLYFALIFVIPQQGFPQIEDLVSFELEDQFGREYRDEEFRDKMIVLIGSDGRGSEYNRKWGEAISKALEEDKEMKYDIHWIGVADLRSAPFFMKGYIRNQFSEDENEWVLLDWDGIVPEAYNFQPGESNILIFNSKGRLVYQTTGEEVRKQEVNQIVKVIRENY